MLLKYWTTYRDLKNVRKQYPVRQWNWECIFNFHYIIITEHYRQCDGQQHIHYAWADNCNSLKRDNIVETDELKGHVWTSVECWKMHEVNYFELVVLRQSGWLKGGDRTFETKTINWCGACGGATWRPLHTISSVTSHRQELNQNHTMQ